MAFWNRKPRPAPSISVSITSNCVIRPGDVVIIPTSEMMMFDLDAAARETLHASVRRLLPAGASSIFVPMREPMTPANLTWLLEEIVGHFSGDRTNNASNNGGPEPFRSNDAAQASPCETADLAKRSALSRDGDQRPDVEPTTVLRPDPAPSLSDTHSGASL